MTLKRLEAALGIIPMFSDDVTLLKVYVLPAPVCEAEPLQIRLCLCSQHHIGIPISAWLYHC